VTALTLESLVDRIARSSRCETDHGVGSQALGTDTRNHPSSYDSRGARAWGEALRSRRKAPVEFVATIEDATATWIGTEGGFMSRLLFLSSLVFAIGCGVGPEASDESLYLTGTEEGVMLQGGQMTCRPGKVLVCHIPPGNPANAHTICVGEPAADPHVQLHGDTLGACATEPNPPPEEPPPPPPDEPSPDDPPPPPPGDDDVIE